MIAGKTTRARPTNDRKLHLLRQAQAEILAEVLREGFYGTATIELGVADGTIQYIRRRVEHVDR